MRVGPRLDVNAPLSALSGGRELDMRPYCEVRGIAAREAATGGRRWGPNRMRAALGSNGPRGCAAWWPYVLRPATGPYDHPEHTCEAGAPGVVYLSLSQILVLVAPLSIQL